MITVAEAARRLGRSIEQVRRYLREGKLRGQRIGQQWFIEEASLGPVHRPSRDRPQRIGEPAAIMETREITETRWERLLSEGLVARTDRLREEIRRKYGAFNVAEMVRQSREEH